MLLYLLSWLATLLQVGFVTIAMASALYYLAELVEENTALMRQIIRITITSVSIIYVGLLVLEDIPWFLVLSGLLQNAMYFLLLRDFPYVSTTSLTFVLSIAFVFLNHYLAFQYFSNIYHPFSEILGYFTICQWVIPFEFFISLSANDNVLPTILTDQQDNTGDRNVREVVKCHGILEILNSLKLQLNEFFSGTSFKKI